MNKIVFWFVVLTALPALVWHYGFEAGFEKGRSTPAKCSDRSPEGKVLSGVDYDADTNKTVCTYVRDVYGRGKWVQKL